MGIIINNYFKFNLGYGFNVKHNETFKIFCFLFIPLKIKINKNSELYKKIHFFLNKEKALKDWYKNTTGEELNLKNPKTFNEKIQWLKIYDSTKRKTLLADKYLVRNWIKEQIGEEYLIPLLGVWNKAEEINFQKLPKQFVLKCNHGCGYNIIITDKSKINIEAIERQLNTWLKEDFGFKRGFQIHYSPIKRKIIAEKYISPEKSNIEIQVYCFNSEIKMISYETCKDESNHKRVILNKNWEKLNIIINPLNYKEFETIPIKPKNYAKFLQICKKLSKGFKFVRIDFIKYENKFFFREMTFTSGSGLSIIEPKSTQYLLGDYIKI